MGGKMNNPQYAINVPGGAVLLIALYVGDILTWRELVVKRYYGHGNPDLSGACSINKRDGK
jgi:hypothetical protein